MEFWYALVDLLPFEWAQPGSMYFMKNALLALLLDWISVRKTRRAVVERDEE